MFAFFSLLICVVALNALIAYMGESFTKVNDNMAEELLRQRAGLLIELIALEQQDHNVRDREEKESMWSYCLAPTAQVDIIDNVDDAEEAQQGLEELLRNQGTILERLEEKLVPARPSSSEEQQGKIKAEIEDMFRLQEVKLEKKLGELSTSSQLRQQQLENKIDAALVSIQSATALILPKIASTPRTGGLNMDDVVPATSPVASDMLGVLPADVTRRLDSIQNDHTGGRVETARASF